LSEGDETPKASTAEMLKALKGELGRGVPLPIGVEFEAPPPKFLEFQPEKTTF